MLVDERREHILQIIENNGFVSVQQLMETCNASESTVRRDLEFLDGIGQIRRTRGGAAFVGESLTGFEDRSQRASKEKRELAKAAVKLIQAEETLLLDGGTTTLEVARQLIGRPFQIVTNSLPVANLFVAGANTDLILVGGYVHPWTGVLVGPYADQMLASLYARRAVLSTAGITERGCFNSNLLLVETERTMMDAADEVIVLADSTKFGHQSLAHICELKALDAVVVDDEISDRWRAILADAGVRVHIAQAHETIPSKTQPR